MSLDNYPIDDDYVAVDNREPSVDIARSCRHETDNDAQEPDSRQSTDTRQSVDDRHETDTYHESNTYQTSDETSEWQQRSESFAHTLQSPDNGFDSRSGTVSRFTDDDVPTDSDGRGWTRTWFKLADVGHSPHSTDRWKRMKKFQAGVWSPDRDSQNGRAENRRLVETFGSYCNCSQFQRDVAEHIIDVTEMRHFGPYPKELRVLAALSIATFICDERDIKDEAPYHELLKSLDTNPSEMQSCRSLLREKSDYFS
jgi:hypothetical protein